MTRAALYFAAALAGAACAARPATSRVRSGPVAAPTSSEGVLSAGRGNAPDGATRDAGEDAAIFAPDAAAEAPGSAAPFPPPPFAPPEARTRAPGDGTWHAVADFPALSRTVVHPHSFKRYVYVAVVAIDLSRLQLEVVAGTRQPVAKAGTGAPRTGLVPRSDWARLVAVFNGGWKSEHGHFGMAVGGRVIAPPIAEACTVALEPDGRVRVAPWARIAPRADEFAAYRQTPKCLLVDGTLASGLAHQWSSRKWGMAHNGKTEVRRSALGVDRSGRVAFYGLGEWITAPELARSMRLAGAQSVAELDINWSYTRFLFYRSGSDRIPKVVSTLIPKIKHGKGEYVTKPSPRDFFYLVRR